MIFNKVARPISCILILFSCNNSNHNTKVEAQKDTAHICMQVPQRFGANSDSSIGFGGDSSYVNMVLIPGGSFEMGGDNDQAAEDEFPKHKVTIAPFYMDITEVTNGQFQRFVNATGYITTAERKPDWEELKKSLPPGTPKPAP